MSISRIIWQNETDLSFAALVSPRTGQKLACAGQDYQSLPSLLVSLLSLASMRARN